jgi:glutathione peroxidase-family protein
MYCHVIKSEHHQTNSYYHHDCRPETCPKIKQFAANNGVQFQMMNKVDVNGPDAHPVYLFMKKVAGPPRIRWNFGTYFVVTTDGTVASFSGVEPMELVPAIQQAMGVSNVEL